MKKLRNTLAELRQQLNTSSEVFSKSMASLRTSTKGLHWHLCSLTLVFLSWFLFMTVTAPNKLASYAQTTLSPCANGRVRVNGRCPAMPACARQCSFTTTRTPYCPNYWKKIQTGVNKNGTPIYNFIVNGFENQVEVSTNLPCAWEKP